MTVQENTTRKIEQNAIMEIISERGLQYFGELVLAQSAQGYDNESAITLVALNYAQNKAWGDN